MKITLSDGREIEMKGFRGKHLKKVMRSAAKIQNSENPEQDAFEYYNLLDEITMELSGLTIEELDELLVDDLNQLRRYITDKVQKSINFLGPSTN